MFDAFRELSDTPIDSKDPNMIKAQIRSKEVVKIIHVTSVVQPLYYEAMRILFVRKVNKNNDFIERFVSSASPCSAILESITYVNIVYNIFTQIHCLCPDQSVNYANRVSTYCAIKTEQQTLFTYVILSKMPL